MNIKIPNIKTKIKKVILEIIKKILKEPYPKIEYLNNSIIGVIGFNDKITFSFKGA
jgi:hypothetical protein